MHAGIHVRVGIDVDPRGEGLLDVDEGLLHGRDGGGGQVRAEDVQSSHAFKVLIVPTWGS